VAPPSGTTDDLPELDDHGRRNVLNVIQDVPAYRDATHDDLRDANSEAARLPAVSRAYHDPSPSSTRSSFIPHRARHTWATQIDGTVSGSDHKMLG
jgi:hypothetical protein